MNDYLKTLKSIEKYTKTFKVISATRKILSVFLIVYTVLKAVTLFIK